MFGAADNDLVVAHLVVVERVQGVAQFEHDVVRNVNDVADACNAGGFEPVLQPFWRRLDLDVSNDARGEAAAKLRCLNFDANGFARFGAGTFLRPRRSEDQGLFVDGGDFAADSQVTEAIGAIRTDFGFNNGAVGAVFQAADVRAGKREPRRELLRRGGDVHEIFQPVVYNLHLLVLISPERPTFKNQGWGTRSLTGDTEPG